MTARELLLHQRRIVDRRQSLVAHCDSERRRASRIVRGDNVHQGDDSGVDRPLLAAVSVW